MKLVIKSIRVRPYFRIRRGKLERIDAHIRAGRGKWMEENLKDSIKYLKSRLKKLKDDDPRRAGYEKELRTYTRILKRYRKNEA